MSKSKRWAATAATVASTWLAAGLLLLPLPLRGQTELWPDDVTEGSLKFTKIYGLLEEHYAEPLDPDRTIFDGGIRGMLSILDPFSAFFDPAQFEQLREQTRGKVRGFGSILYVQPGKVMVLQTAEGSPSRRAGLGPGDEIVEVNGQRLDRLDLQGLVELLSRARTQRVRLGVVRPGRVVAQDFELNPADVDMPTVDRAFIFSPGIGYLHISGFDQKTPHEARAALGRLGAEKLNGLLVDLRDNPGGVLESAVGVASIFLPEDIPVITVRGRAFPEKVYRTRVTTARYDLPLITLVNRNTASAAEVLAAALQEHDRALVVGEPTFGKGVIETVTALSEKTGLALTTAQYFTPSRRSLQRPLAGTALAVPEKSLPSAGGTPEFRTLGGRIVSAGGGVAPDFPVSARSLDPWLIFLEQRGIFTNFASHFLTVNRAVTQTFEPDAKVLADFRSYVDRRRIRVPVEYWNQDQDYLKLRIQAELFNLVYGLATGEEVEVRADPQVQKAARLFPEIPRLLKAPQNKSPATPTAHPSGQQE